MNSNMDNWCVLDVIKVVGGRRFAQSGDDEGALRTVGDGGGGRRRVLRPGPAGEVVAAVLVAGRETGALGSRVDDGVAAQHHHQA